MSKKSPCSRLSFPFSLKTLCESGALFWKFATGFFITCLSEDNACIVVKNIVKIAGVGTYLLGRERHKAEEAGKMKKRTEINERRD